MIDWTTDITADASGLDRITTWFNRRPIQGDEKDGTFHDPALVLDVQSEWAVERGGTKNSIHSHIVFRVKHTGVLTFDRLKIKEDCKNFMDLPKLPNVKVKLLGNPKEADFLRDYLEKGVKDFISGSYGDA